MQQEAFPTDTTREQQIATCTQGSRASSITEGRKWELYQHHIFSAPSHTRIRDCQPRAVTSTASRATASGFPTRQVAVASSYGTAMRLRTRRAAWLVLALLLSTACSLAAVVSAAEGVDEALLPADLTVNTFDGALQGLPADRWALIEFFASWCPACQHFKPTYEQVSAALRREPLPQPEVWVARVDCAKEVRIFQSARGAISKQH